ncbi:MAG: 4-(cytidine 5'-diphospho)-2-C-methyl-D-erythritol kinase [Patescibacteria group bacterium]
MIPIKKNSERVNPRVNSGVNALRVKAFAKINLGLKILGKRADGFHELDTIFARIGVFDELEFRLRSDSKILVNVENADIPTKQNLVFRAAWILQKFAPGSPGVEISLRKKIPLGAGLGGGSSDAAAVLRTLPKIWGLKITPEKLHKIAASLGSDVPFFLAKRVCRGRGRGELLEPIALPKQFPREALVVVPPIKISTAWAYDQIKIEKLKLKNNNKKIDTRGQGTEIKQKNLVSKTYSLKPNPCTLTNDFERIVFREFSEIRQIKKQLEKSGSAIASLSGSGSAVFGLFRKRPSREIIQELSQFGSVFVAKIRE